MLTNETVPSDKIIQISNAKELIMQNLVSANQVIWVWTGNGKELYMLCCHVAQKSFTSFTKELKMKVCEWEFTWSSSRDDYRSWKFSMSLRLLSGSIVCSVLPMTFCYLVYLGDESFMVRFHKTQNWQQGLNLVWVMDVPKVRCGRKGRSNFGRKALPHRHWDPKSMESVNCKCWNLIFSISEVCNDRKTKKFHLGYYLMNYGIACLSQSVCCLQFLLEWAWSVACNEGLFLYPNWPFSTVCFVTRFWNLFNDVSNWLV
jgi:hypothetical protein